MTKLLSVFLVLVSGSAFAAENGVDPDAAVYAAWGFPLGVGGLRAATATIRADICNGFVPVLNFKTCPFADDWVSEADLDRDGAPEYILRARAPWEGSGGAEVRIYRVKGNTLERIYRGFTETIEPLYGLGKQKPGAFPRMLAVIRVGFCGRQFVYLDWSGDHYREHEAYTAELDHPDCKDAAGEE